VESLELPRATDCRYFSVGMTDAPGLRVSDADRERTAAALREHFAAGRIDGAELDERLQAAYTARTEVQLQDLLRDLPTSVSQQEPPAEAVLAERAALAARRDRLRRGLEQQVGGGVGVFLLCTVIWAATGANGSFWPIWVLVATLVVVLRAGWNLWGPAPDLDRVEEDLDRARRRSQRRSSRRPPDASG